jgi:hypothetical protein
MARPVPLRGRRHCSAMPDPSRWRSLTVKARITNTFLLISVLVLGGCLSTNPDKALQTISQWIPPGTSQEDVVRIMKQHGYEGGPSGRDWRHPKREAVFCFWHETTILKNTRWFFVHFKDGKVVSIDGWGTGNEFFDFAERTIPSKR